MVKKITKKIKSNGQYDNHIYEVKSKFYNFHLMAASNVVSILIKHAYQTNCDYTTKADPDINWHIILTKTNTNVFKIQRVTCIASNVISMPPKRANLTYN